MPDTNSDKVQENLEKITNDAAAKAGEQAKVEVDKLKQDLVNSIQGEKKKYSWEEKGKKQPDDYDELFDEVDKRTVKPEDIDKRVDEKLEEREQVKLKADEQTRKERETQLADRRKEFDAEWYDLVQQGKMPKVAEEVQERINKNERLTEEEILADEGLKARLELAKLSQSKGKSAKVAYYEDLNQEPAGAKAPVIGGRPAAPQSEDKDLSYDDVSKGRKKIFGF